MSTIELTACTILIVLLIGGGCADSDDTNPVAPDPDPDPDTTNKFQNPIEYVSKDPEVIRAPDSVYYMYFPENNLVDSVEGNYSVYSSSNLIEWELENPSVLTNSDRPFWAAGVLYFKKQYYLYYTANTKGNKQRRDIGVAVSSSPEGPFEDQGIIIDNDRPVIDPFSMQDPKDGKLYLYYSEGIGDSELPVLRSVEMEYPLTPDHSTDQVILTKTQPWEHIVLEHPYVWYHEELDKYYLFYNGAGGALARYSIGYAVGDTPTGPFLKAEAGTNPEDNPLMSQIPEEEIYGIGAPNIVMDDNNKPWMVYRIKNTSEEGWEDRSIHIDPLQTKQDGSLVCRTTKGERMEPPFILTGGD